MHELTSADTKVNKALHRSCNNLQEALKIVDETFASVNAPWIEHCVRETVMRWHQTSRPEEKKKGATDE